MITLASVDLPEPFGPMRAWIWPFSMARSTPLRISFSPALTCRLRISSSDKRISFWKLWLRAGLDDRQRGDALGRRDHVAAARELDQLGERGALERLDDPHLDAHPQKARGARAGLRPVVRAGDPARRRV